MNNKEIETKDYFNDLKEYGNCYSTRNLEFMCQLASNITKDEFVKQPVSEIPWGTIIIIMQKSKSHEEIWNICQHLQMNFQKMNLVSSLLTN